MCVTSVEIAAALWKICGDLFNLKGNSWLFE